MAGPHGELVFAPLGGVGEIGMNLSITVRRRAGAPGRGRCRRTFAAEENLPGVDLIP
jgi:ribonuclease J